MSGKVSQRRPFCSVGGRCAPFRLEVSESGEPRPRSLVGLWGPMEQRPPGRSGVDASLKSQRYRPSASGRLTDPQWTSSLS